MLVPKRLADYNSVVNSKFKVTVNFLQSDQFHKIWSPCYIAPTGFLLYNNEEVIPSI